MMYANYTPLREQERPLRAFVSCECSSNLELETQCYIVAVEFTVTTHTIIAHT
jgi:hypothetical protein